MDKINHLNIVGHLSTSNVFILGQIKALKRSQRLGELGVNLIKRVTGVVLVVKLNEILFLLDIGIVIFSKIIVDICILIPNFKGVFVILLPNQNKSVLLPLIHVETHALVYVKVDVVIHVLSNVIQDLVHHVKSPHVQNVTAP